MHEATTQHHLSHPGTEGGVAAVVTDVLHHGQHGVLKNVFCGGPVLDHAPDQRERGSRDFVIQGAHGSRVGGGDPLQPARVDLDSLERAHTP